jgi:hypothetical protein
MPENHNLASSPGAKGIQTQIKFPGRPLDCMLGRLGKRVRGRMEDTMHMVSTAAESGENWGLEL